jgi:RNA polymerase sigma-70 factor (ECF subfamily)
MVLLELVADVAQGNKSAFAKLYGLTNRKLLGIALRILGDRALAEDVLQESYFKVWRNAASYNPAIASPMAWMATIVRHGGGRDERGRHHDHTRDDQHGHDRGDDGPRR